MSGARPETREADNLARLRRALAAIERLEAELAEARRARAPEPIAIVGIGCRLPGGIESPEDYWRLLAEGRDATTEVPPDRWDAAALYDPDPERAGFLLSRRGGFVALPRAFDAAFFGIAPREAASLDPQQRLLLEVTWEALERAGLDPLSLQGSATGVFTAICGQDYAQLLAARGLATLDAYYASGTVHAMASGRLSYVLGLQGPSLSVDTACSSSLVAVHLACRSLRSGECDLALAGGVNLILTPTYSATFSRARMLSPDGRCKGFDAAADGYGRAEGCGVVVLKRLSDALAAGDRIEAVIRGSAVNQDGASSGLTVPNGPAQQAVIRAALADAGATLEEVGYLEAHGTGTALGDPIELGAIGAVLAGAHDPEDPLWVASAKSNLGHAEGAAGIAGLIKAALVLRESMIPPQLHFHAPNPHADWQGGRLAVPTALQPWPAGRRLAGVSSFGFSGTNAHVILEVPPAAEPEQAAAGPALLLLSARTPEALAESAARLAAHLEAQPGLDLTAVAATLATGRAALPHRLAVVAESPAEAVHLLCRPLTPTPLPQGERGFEAQTAQFAPPLPSWERDGVRGVGFPAAPSGEPETNQTPSPRPSPRGRGRTGGPPPGVSGVVCLFTGQGALAGGEGAALYEREPAFREVVERCAAALGLAAAPRDGSQLSLFLLQVGLAALWRARGLRPAAVLGHSLGEYAAAVTAGVLTPEAGARLVAARGRLMQALPDDGAMATLFAGEATVAALLRDHPGLEIAALNGPEATVVSGGTAALDALLAALPAGIEGTRLATSRAFHSARMEPMLPAFREALEGERFALPEIPFVSTLTGRAERELLATPDYWLRQIREPVRFAPALQGLAGTAAFLELGPAPVLSGLGRRLPELEGAVWAASLRPDQDERRTLLQAAGELWAAGVELDRGALAGPRRRPLDLPTYPWQRTRHWIEGLEQAAAPAQGQAGRQAARATEVGGFYDALTAVFEDYAAYGAERPELDLFLTYAPFPEAVPGFSWIGTLRRPRERSEHLELMLRQQRELRALAFRHVDLAAARSALDFGCGYGADLLALARRHPDLRLTGQTVSPRQAEIAGAAAARAGLGERVRVRVQDSSRAPAEPTRHDLVFGFEVAHHIADKPALFRSLGRQLAEGGRLVLADFVALGGLGVEDDKTHSGFPTREAWVALLSDNGLLLDDLLDVSPEVANFLHDPALEEELAALRLPGSDAPADEAVREAFRGFVRLGGLLRRGLAAYVLLSAARRGDLEPAELRRLNAERIAAPLPYAAASPERWLYAPAWHPERPLPAPAAIAEALAAAPAAEAGPETDFERLAALRAGLDRLARRWAATALKGLDAAAVAPERRRAFDRLAVLAAEAEPGAPAPLAAELAAAFPEGQRELALLQRCGPALAAVLRGERDPLEPLLGDGGALLAGLYRDAPTARLMNGLAARAVAAAVAALPPGGPLRVLELGAGTGGTTAALLPLLPPGSDYLFTDVSPQFLAGARDGLGDPPGLRTAVFDLERPAAEQGLAEERFDLIVAANVLHATRDVAQALRHAAALLAPGGLLLLLEGSAPAGWVDATFGLTEGWWRFTDTDLRAEHPLLDAAGWRRAFAAAGLEPGAVVAPPGGRPLPLDQLLLLTRRPPEPAAMPEGGWLLLGAGPLAAEAARRLGPQARQATSLEDALAVLEERPWRGLLDLRGAEAPEGDAPAAAEAAAAEALALLQALAGRGTAPPLRLVTRGAVAARPGDPLPDPARAALWGLGRVALLEHPELDCRLLDLDPAAEDPAADLLQALAETGEEPQSARRGGESLRLRLVRRTWPSETPPAPLRAEGTWLIAGGLGGLGVALAGRLAERGATRLLLAGRSAPSPAQAAAVAVLRARGLVVETHRLDVTDAAAVRALVAAAGPLRGVVQAAGVLDDAALLQLDAGRLARVMGPKVAGAWALHEATRARPPEHFILFASVAGLLGNAGQGNHAAANACLDALAAHRRALGLPATAIDWGAWSGIGAAEREAAALPGVTAFTPAQGLDLFERLLAEAATQAMVLPVDWPAYAAALPAAAARSLALLLPAAGTAAEAPAAAAVDPADPAQLRDWLARQAGAALGLGAALPDRGAPLTDFGFDSLMAIGLRNRIRAELGVELPMAALLGGTSLAALAEEVEARLAAEQEEIDALVAAMSDEEVEAEMRRLTGSGAA